ncbi:acyltransferase family protein [Lucifera butyrica]|uniref:acyltransferase family protein n=1 Tax=Lucifera butyrica TaxID=1351585 RepID=UPI001A9D3853|nr:acyltransferase family protein [Lucifera butyrica]
MESASNRTGNRIYFLDNLRAFIVLLVIAFHVSITYMAHAPQWWYVVDTQNSSLFTLFVMATDVYIMPIMFFIAGYFAVPVLQRKGTIVFLKDKFFRIVLPWIGGVLFLAPVITYMIWYSRSSTPPEYFLYVKTMFFTPVIFNHAHYWFLGELSYFFLGVAILYTMNPAIFERKAIAQAPSGYFFPLFGFIMAVSFFIPSLFFLPDTWFNKLYIISLQPSRFGAYIGYFVLGIYAWKNLWFTDGGYMPRLGRWFSAAIILLIVFLVYRVTFADTTPLLLKVGNAALHSYFCLAAVFAFIAFFHRYVDSSAYLWRRLSANSYTMYYIHQLIVISATYMALKIQLPVFFKYLLVAGSCMVLCFLLSEYVIGKLKRLPPASSGNKQTI